MSLDESIRLPYFRLDMWTVMLLCGICLRVVCTRCGTRQTAKA